MEPEDAAVVSEANEIINEFKKQQGKTIVSGLVLNMDLFLKYLQKISVENVNLK